MSALQQNEKSQLVRLQEFPGVGTPDHFSGMTEEMNALRKSLIATHHQQYSRKPSIPKTGEFVVAGYLKTSRFELKLESVDQVALLRYDLPKLKFAFQTPSCKQAILRLSGESHWRPIACQTISLSDFCYTIGVPNPLNMEILEIIPQSKAVN